MELEAWLARAAKEAPERLAIEGLDGTACYRELFLRARRAARALQDEGVGVGDWVGIRLEASLAFATWLHGALLLGAVAVPIDPRLSGSEQQRLEERCAVVVSAHRLPARSLPEGRFPYALDRPAVVIHTSGTTGLPRPVCLTYRNLLYNALGSAAAFGVDPQERYLCLLPVSHVGGLTILTRSVIYCTTAVLHPRFEREAALAALEGGGITAVSLVATTLGRLLDLGWERPRTLRFALTGGGPVASPLVQRARAAGIPISLTYGLTQACAQVASEPLSALGEGLRPLFCTKVRISPAGEILVRGFTVAPTEVAADGWLYTGDRGQLREDGALVVEGRLSETIISGGENVSPAEVEEALLTHPAVAEAAVFARPDPQWGEMVCAAVVLQAGARVEGEELRRYCRAQLAPYKVPKQFFYLDRALPRTGSGKVLRRAVPTLLGLDG